MKKIVALAVVFAVAFSTMAFAGSLTDKVNKLIDTNQARLERTYNLRDASPHQLALRLGPPLGFGVEYSYNMNEVFAIVIGAGSIGGLNADLGFNWYVLNTAIAPVVNAGIAYVNGDVCFEGGAGVDVQLDTSLGVQLGLNFTKQIINAPAGDFHFFNYADPANVLFINGGLSYRFK